MKQIKGILLIGVTIVITLLLWAFAAPDQDILPLDRVRHLFAGLALNGFFMNFALSTRNQTLEKWFGGLDKMYRYHKVLAITSMGFLFIHLIISDQLKVTDQINLQVITGGLGVFLFVLLIAITLFFKKLPYEKWHLSHKFMIIPYLVGLFHTYISSHIPLTQPSLLSYWTAFTAIIGILSAIYTIFFSKELKFKYKGTVTNISKLNSNVLEWEVTLKKPINFFKGQFAFVKVFQEGIESEPHPFTISGGTDNAITFTTKISGDFTKQLYDSLTIGTKAAVEGPYGLMDFEKGKKKQLWVAGGIGVTPFIAYLREDHPDKEIDFYYSFFGTEAGIYKDLISEYQKRNKLFTAHMIDTSTQPFLTFEGYSLSNDTDVFMCGPQKMISVYAKYFKNNNKKARVSYEAFALR